jgi:hypothetical protein
MAGVSNGVLTGIALPTQGIPHEQLGVKQILLAANSGQAI